VGRAQVLWGLSGLIFGFGLLTGMLAASTFGLTGVIGATAFDVGGAVAYTVMGLMLGIAITRYHLFDIDVIIRRTLIYSVLTALLALTYFGSVLAMQGLLRGVTRDDSPVVIVLSTLLIAAMAAPLRARVQRGIDRRFYRRKYDAARTLANFATTARDEVDLDRLSARLVDVVKDTMQPEHASLWIRQAGWAERRPR
jgi:hypothetical protein